MPKETKEQRKEREDREYREYFTKVSSTWALRFANIMAEYANLPGFQVSQTDSPGIFKFSTPDTTGYNLHHEVSVTLEFDTFYDSLSEMEDAESSVRRYRERQAEQQREYRVYQGALAKLNEEEQKLLKSYWGM